MCQRIDIDIKPDGTIRIFPTECDDGGVTCRTLSAPYMALGDVVEDRDFGTSHLVTVDVVIKDLDALEAAASECGLEFVRDQKTYRWYGHSVGDYNQGDAAQKHGIALDGRCEHALRVPGNARAYEIGIVADPEGRGYRLVWDHWNRGYGLSAHVSRHAAGTDLEKLTHAYSCAAVAREAARRRQPVTRRVEADGTTRMTVTILS